MQKINERTLLVASTGGHLEQLHRLVKHNLVPTKDRRWISFEHPQTESLLHSEHVTFVDYIPSRGIGRSLRAFPKIYSAIKKYQPDGLISTGAAIAVPTAMAALFLAKKMQYIESVSRFDGPSLTGKILSLFPNVETYTQHASWANRRWRRGPNVLGNFTATNVPESAVKRVFISLGTIKPYRFDRAVEVLQAIIPTEVDVRIQYGSTSRDYGHWHANELISSDQFLENMQWADVNILHAGVGSALNVLDLGKMPILLVRSQEFNEHVDDHQKQIATFLSQEGLAIAPALEGLSWSAIQASTQVRVISKL